MTSHFLLFISLFGPAIGAAASADPTTVAPLFADDEIVDVTITAPFDEILGKRSVEDELPGTLVYRDAATGEDVALEIKIRARGKFRRQKETCSFPPLRINVRKSNETLFADSDKLKLVTHCRNRSTRYEQSLYKEYLAYRILNILTDLSFRARLLNVRYIDADDGKEVASSPAFLIEDDKQLARRLGMHRDESEKTSVAALDPAHTNLVALFQYLIGNTDFSPVQGPPGEPCCHNYVLFGAGETLVSIPYDFDVTGFADPPHADPNPRFRLNSVKERLYRGRCANNGQLASSIARFEENRQAIYDLVNSQPGMSDRDKNRITKYMDEFYATIRSEREVRSEFLEACLGG